MIPTSQYLREATKSAHVDTEKAANLKSLFQGSFDRAGYADLLAANHAVWQVIATTLQEKATASGLPGTELLKAVSYLAADLKELNKPLSKQIIQHPDLSGDPEIFGTAYVLYGSTLGSRYIHQALKKQLGEEGESILGFYRFCATQPAGFWPEFKAALDEKITTPADQERAAVAARGVFKVFANAYTS